MDAEDEAAFAPWVSSAILWIYALLLVFMAYVFVLVALAFRKDSQLGNFLVLAAIAAAFVVLSISVIASWVWKRKPLLSTACEAIHYGTLALSFTAMFGFLGFVIFQGAGIHAVSATLAVAGLAVLAGRVCWAKVRRVRSLGLGSRNPLPLPPGV